MNTSQWSLSISRLTTISFAAVSGQLPVFHIETLYSDVLIFLLLIIFWTETYPLCCALNYRINVDPDRFPSMISEANCRHFNCLDSKRMPVINMNSVAIKQEILVIKRKQTGCRQTYWLEKKLVTVGCTCAMASTYASSG